jgi:hypothetical protein
MNLSKLTDLSFSYYWMPYLAKVLFPFYWPAGKQAIKSIKNIPNNLPIIIIHSEEDTYTSYKDACAIYYGLRANGNENVYLIPKSGSKHSYLIDADSKYIIKNVLKKHGLIKDYVDAEEDNLNIFQPDPKPFRKTYNDLIYKEKNHERLGYILIIGTIYMICRVLIIYVI